MKLITLFLAAVVPCFGFSCEAKEYGINIPYASHHIGFTPPNIINVWQCGKCGTINSGFDTHCSACGTPRNGEIEEEDFEE